MELKDQSLQELSKRALALGCDPSWIAMTCRAGDEEASRAKLVHWCSQHAKDTRQNGVPSVASIGMSDAMVPGKSPVQKAPPERKSRRRDR